MHTSLHVDGANCPSCFNETVDIIAELDGVQKVHGSFAGPCIEVDHEESAIEEITLAIQAHLHGIQMYSDEAGMAPIELTISPSACSHHHESDSTQFSPAMQD